MKGQAGLVAPRHPISVVLGTRPGVHPSNRWQSGSTQQILDILPSSVCGTRWLGEHPAQPMIFRDHLVIVILQNATRSWTGSTVILCYQPVLPHDQLPLLLLHPLQGISPLDNTMYLFLLEHWTR